ncbi:7-carboxy-7-deazaguanine synthase (Cx14CxxC type) [Endobacter medicaginis]|uniref:7-carboxy-7-deazaguanine synthase n=1 Tax=Endobacter medicaginis TaxID=1181271 RepID=A0A850NPI9_9PROT|nr:7-carboxy-7-deazaguanine synthase [Endobacter medicaginis]MBB3172394.1 7-carboxy-7-deazaguanine synthase (Cx14CxxC type) [Endobacter medicaginis]MCX5474116.1 7-carboxy-7-deazaguanine synthase [Endobacter medicaginis]NVN30000.1 7-carboxy-7-deazaguanine synthase [Endobacter medicaginis]
MHEEPAASGRRSYAIREMFATLQGEGGQAGRVSVFCRFAGCNLWTGREADRAAAVCRFCDTEFVGTDGSGGGRFGSAEALAEAIERMWPGEGPARRYVVFTGGEPLLQLDAALIGAVRARGFEVAVETNGTIEAPAGIDWICVSPKAGAEWRQRGGAELKLVYPQPELMPEACEDSAFGQYFLQPMDGPDRVANTEAAIAYCLAHPKWRLSVQTHKMLGIP